MIGPLVAGFLQNFSMVMLVAAMVLAAASACLQRSKPQGGFADRLLGWLLLLPVGAVGIYTFVMHVFFPATSAGNIGWAVSPFQYEVGIADLTIGLLGVLAFWGDFSFRLAAVVAATVWYGGDAVGHVRQMIVAHNFAPGNAGPWFWTDVLVPLLLVACITIVWRHGDRAERDPQ